MSLLADFYVDDTGEFLAPNPLPSVEIITRPIVPNRRAFAVLGTSGEFPLGIRPPAPGLADPAETLRISVPVTYGSPIEPERPRRYVGAHRGRLVRSRAALADAIAQGGTR